MSDTAWKYDFEVVGPQSKRGRKATIYVRDANRQIVLTCCEDLYSHEGRRKVAKEAARKLGGDATTIENLLTNAWNEALNRLEQEPPAEEAPADVTVQYHDAPGYLCRQKLVADSEVTVPLANFTARIVEEVVRDDGAEQSTAFIIEGKLADGRPLPRGEVPAERFPWMRWPVELWGTRAVVHAGAGVADHARCAIQILSGDVPRRVTYGHTGWRRIGAEWVYLHAGGAIGAAGSVDGVSVLLPEPLANFLLPTPPEGIELQDAVRSSLRLLDLGSDRATFPLLAAAYRAVLGNTDFTPHLAGPTGAYKSEAAALAQQHFGAGLDARHLPGNWSSTANALEGIAFAAKDALLVVDDFAPAGSSADVQRLHREADRLLRAQGNRAGRLRMQANATLRPAKPPRGLILSTGEDVPRGQSLRARLFAIEVAKGDFGPQPPDPNPKLSACQKDAAEGKYAASLAGFVRWLAPQYETVRGQLRTELDELRDKARTKGQHARTPATVADLALGLRYFLEFALSAGAISTSDQEELWERGWNALTETAAAQAEHQAAAEPCCLFLRLLVGAIASGRAHVAGPNGSEPALPGAWGWRETHDGPQSRWQHQGRRLGWVEGSDLYLEPEAAYAEAQELARTQGDSLPVSARTLRKRLRERGLLASTDTEREVLTVRRTLEGRRREVLHLRSAVLSPPEPDQPDQQTQKTEESGRVAGRVTPEPSQNPTSNPTTKPDQKPEENSRLVGLVGSDTGEEALLAAPTWQEEVAEDRRSLLAKAANCRDAALAGRLNALANEEPQSFEEALDWHDRQVALEAEWRRNQQSAVTVNGQHG
jgi:hypothetical protein